MDDLGAQKEFEHAKLGLRLIVRASADDLVQRDMDKFMAAYQKQTQGASLPEDNGKTVRAAFTAGWIESLTTPKGAISTAADVDEMKPAQVRWVAQQIDAIYSKARDIPNA
jgi:hypothetical protein